METINSILGILSSLVFAAIAYYILLIIITRHDTNNP